MRQTGKKIVGVVLPFALVLLSSHLPAQEKPQTDQTSIVEREVPVGEPDLAEIIPSASKLSGPLAALEKKIANLLDLPALEKGYAKIEASLKAPAKQLERVKDSKEYKYYKLLELKEAIKQENELFEEISKPLIQAIRQLGIWRKEWLAEKKRWNEWQSFLLKEVEFDQLKSTFEKANQTIEAALALVLPKLAAMLTVQEKAGEIQSKISTLGAELEGLIMDERRGALLKASPPMFSSQFYSQFGSGLWYALQKCLYEISWPDSRFLSRQGWILFVQVFIFLFSSIAIYLNRRKLKESKRWCFLAARPFSAGLFLAYMMTVFIAEYGGGPGAWKLANTLVGGISFVRLMGALIETSWKRQLVYGLTIVLIITRFLDVLSFPLPIFRLYTVLTALVGILFCLRSAKQSALHKDSGLYAWSLRLGALFFAVIMIAEFWGKSALSLYLFVCLIDSIVTVLVFLLSMYLINGGLELLFRTSTLRRATMLDGGDPDAIARRLSRFIAALVLGLILLPAILMIWGVFDNLEEATNGVLSFGFKWGSQRISIGLIIASAGILYGSILASGIFQKLLMDEVLVRRKVEKGVRHAIARLVHYFIIFAGFLFALSVLGLEISKITILLSALGVGIGFGLQSIVNNFVSGLILLFERPVRIGDSIELGGKWAEIKKIGLRATTVLTLDQADVIIPNADLITNQVTNWTLSNRQVRLTIPVGVAYGSDVALVMKTLMECAESNAMVNKAPSPQVLFLSFGESSLDFELRVWVLDADHRLKVKSELHQEIDRSFREAKIEIAFPQRDLHLRSVDDSVILRPSDTVR